MGRRARDAPLAKAFGDRVRARREARGLSREDLADLAGLHRTMVGHVERGETTPTLYTIARLASALGVDTGVLVRGLRPGA